MKVISHRGNLNGPNKQTENTIESIKTAINLGFDVEIDVWYIDKILYLGHDSDSLITDHNLKNFLLENSSKLWIHCKNVEAMEWFNSIGGFNYFWHQEDTLTLTSMNVIWAYPGKQPIIGSIAVIPEIFNDKLDSCIGVCSDYIENYK